MGTYDHKQILSDYANGRMTVEMAMGHALQHIEKLYELQTTANLNRYALRGRVDTLDDAMSTLRAEVAQLAVLVKKIPSNKPQKGQ